MTHADRPDYAAEIRRALVDPKRLLAALGFDRGAIPQASGYIICCPWHEDRTPSCSVQRCRVGILAKCHACGHGGDALSLVAVANGLDTGRDFPAVLRAAALVAGLRDIADAIDGGAVAPRPAKPVAPPPPAEPERVYPPTVDVLGLWNLCVPVATDEQVASYLRGRAIDPEAVAALDVARAIPIGADLPRWASYRGAADRSRPWTETGHRLIVPVVDALGAVRSVRAWRVIDGDGPKRLPPAGHRASGLVLADARGRELLRRGRAAGDDVRVLVVEGEPDFLTWACRAADGSPALFGVLSGGWTDEHARRVPGGAHVVLRTHHDKAGDKYAREIADTLRGRCATVRPSGDGTGRDDNDLARAGELPNDHDAGAQPFAVEWMRWHPREFVLGREFAAAAWLGEQIRPGAWAVRCPTEALHADGDRLDGSTVVEWNGRGPGRLTCSHPECGGVLGAWDLVVRAVRRVVADEERAA